MKSCAVMLIILALLNTGCALVVNKEQIHANTAIPMPPEAEIRIGVLPLLAPGLNQTGCAGYWGGEGSIRTLENSGQIVADAITAVLLDMENFTPIERAQLVFLQVLIDGCSSSSFLGKKRRNIYEKNLSCHVDRTRTSRPSGNP